MSFNPEKHDRRSIRLKEYDYSQTGSYFVTLCTYQKQCWLGEVRHGKMHLNQIGKIVASEWLYSSQRRQEIGLDEWIIMPNHLHGIVIIDDHQMGASLKLGAIPEVGANSKLDASPELGASLHWCQFKLDMAYW